MERESTRRRGQSGMSYKFQRLREKIRQAVGTGELAGKLPGERELARRFHVNAKTLSKALTDLAAEGLLQRSIGRGTFVKGTEPAPAAIGRWLIISDNADMDAELISHLQAHNADSQVMQDVQSMRPSLLNQFAAVIDLGSETPEPFLRDMVVRNMPLVVADRRPRTYSTSGVLMDVPFAAYALGRDMILAGHRRLVAIEGRGRTAVAEALRAAAERYAPDATVDHCYAREITGAVEMGVTAAVCDSLQSAREVMDLLARANLPVPQAVSVAAAARCDWKYPCSGFFVGARDVAHAIIELLESGQVTKPTTLWLSGQPVNTGTVAALPLEAPAMAVQQSMMHQPMLTLESL